MNMEFFLAFSSLCRMENADCVVEYVNQVNQAE